MIIINPPRTRDPFVVQEIERGTLSAQEKICREKIIKQDSDKRESAAIFFEAGRSDAMQRIQKQDLSNRERTLETESNTRKWINIFFQIGKPNEKKTQRRTLFNQERSCREEILKTEPTERRNIMFPFSIHEQHRRLRLEMTRKIISIFRLPYVEIARRALKKTR